MGLRLTRRGSLAGTSNVNCGWVRKRGVVNAARQHFVDFTEIRLARWTLVPYSEHLVDLTKRAMARSTKCTLADSTLPTSLPSRL
jgi:hypothetical protein